MASLNLCQFIGRLGADPEARSTQNGGEVVSFRLACSEQWKDRDGNKQERTEWVSVVIFNEGIAKVAKSYLRKGSQCYVSGQLQTRKWQGQDGQDRYSTEIVLQRFRGELVLLDAKRDGGGQSSQRGGGSSRPSFDDDEPPFISADPALEGRVC